MEWSKRSVKCDLPLTREVHVFPYTCIYPCVHYLYGLVLFLPICLGWTSDFPCCVSSYGGKIINNSNFIWWWLCCDVGIIRVLQEGKKRSNLESCLEINQLTSSHLSDRNNGFREKFTEMHWESSLSPTHLVVNLLINTRFKMVVIYHNR